MGTLYKYIITYTNYFKVDNKTFAFRQKELFEITNTPTWLELKNNNGSKGYWINRKWYSLTKIKELIVIEEKQIDITNLQWYEQEQLNHVFNYISAK